jgi:succinate dehydrogenase / fumarate reductase membrane anchor subunit
MVTGARFGTAHNGLNEWTFQRISAALLAILLPLMFVLLTGVYSGAVTQMALLDILDCSITRLLHTILMTALLVHAHLGLKVIVEDYVHSAGLRIPLMVMLMVVVGGIGIWWLSMIWAWGI